MDKKVGFLFELYFYFKMVAINPNIKFEFERGIKKKYK